VLNKQREECDGLDVGDNTCATYKAGRVYTAPLAWPDMHCYKSTSKTTEHLGLLEAISMHLALTLYILKRPSYELNSS